MATLKLNMDGGKSLVTTREDFPLTGDALLMAVGELLNEMTDEGEFFIGFEDSETGKRILVNVARINTVEEVV